jgi:hypothetical protein
VTTPKLASAPRKRAPAKTAKAAPSKTTKAALATTRSRAAAAGAPTPPPGWYPDPAAPDMQRYWDGDGWVGTSLPVNDPAPAGPDAANPAPSGRILFQGRTMRVHNVSIEQIGVWRRIVRQFEGADEPLPADASDEVVMARSQRLQRLLDRTFDIILSMLVDEADIEWVETQLLTHELTLNQAVKIITLAIEEFKARQAPTNGPVRRDKARRRA